MDRRKTLKTILGGAVGTALFTQVSACKNEDGAAVVPASATEAETKGYGLRNAYEAARDERISHERFFTDFEKDTLGVLADIIVPEGDDHPKATETGVVDFMEFMALDQPGQHQVVMRGGLAWLNAESSKRHDGKAFIELTPGEQIAIVDEIAYPDDAMKIEDNPMMPGVRFFDHLRFLVITGFFTSKEGVAYLGYEGNTPNVWDGPPQEVLDQYGLAYEDKYLPLYVDQSKRDVIAEWDDDMNLIS